MDNITLTLPSGYIATFRPYLTYGQKRQLSKFMGAKMSVDPVTQQSNTLIDGATMMESQDLALKLMLVSVTKPDGTVVEGDAAFQEVQNMQDSDGEAVYAKLDELTAPAQSEDDKKKVSLTSTSSSDTAGV